jgi:membrane protein involved in colicin uptake
MGFLFRGFWNVVLFAAAVTVIGGYALTNAVMSTTGQAFGAGLKGGGTFLSAAGSGFKEADNYEKALSEAQANQDAKDKAAKDKKARAKAKAEAKANAK